MCQEPIRDRLRRLSDDVSPSRVRPGRALALARRCRGLQVLSKVSAGAGAAPRFVLRPPALPLGAARLRPGCRGVHFPGGGLAAPVGGLGAPLAPGLGLHAVPNDAGIEATCSEITVRQEVLKDGFHRDLSVKVKFGESIGTLETCQILIKQHIPKGLLVDPYELTSLQEKNITQALIPVHYRYHRPHSKDGETFVVVNNPDLLIYCDQEFPILKCWGQSKVKLPCALKSNDICLWNNMKYKSVHKNVTVQVPVGLTVHTSLVCSVTLLVTILCSALILMAVFKYGDFSL